MKFSYLARDKGAYIGVYVFFIFTIFILRVPKNQDTLVGVHIASNLTWGAILGTLANLCLSQKFRIGLFQIRWLYIFLGYNAIYTLIFYLIGGYWMEITYSLPETPISHFTSQYLMNTFGNFALCQLWIFPYSMISVILSYILPYKLKYAVPLLLLFVPGISLTLFQAGWRATFGGLFWVAGILLIFQVYYLKSSFLKRSLLALLSAACTLVAFLFRADFFIFFIFAFIINWLILFRVSWKHIILAASVSFFIIKISTPAEINRKKAIVLQYLFSYIHVKFYQDSLWTPEEKTLLRFDEPIPPSWEKNWGKKVFLNV